ncbi:MAG: hypothetical protein ACREQQ_15745 [Candidatus Binatia bacterium]
MDASLAADALEVDVPAFVEANVAIALAEVAHDRRRENLSCPRLSGDARDQGSLLSRSVKYGLRRQRAQAAPC